MEIPFIPHPWFHNSVEINAFLSQLYSACSLPFHSFVYGSDILSVFSSSQKKKKWAKL